MSVLEGGGAAAESGAGAARGAGAAEPLASRLLGNGRTTVLLTEAGTGFTRWGDLWLTPWGDDPVEDPDGFFVYLRERGPDRPLFSAGAAPCGLPIDVRYQRPIWGEESFGTARSEHGLEIVWEGCVPPKPDLDLRRLVLRNRTRRRRVIEATSCIEIVLAPLSAFRAHPVFSKLFVQTWAVPKSGALLARRRPRSSDEATPWLAHAVIDGPMEGYETDRAHFFGRGGTRVRPRALVANARAGLSGTTGNVLDPLFSIRTTVELGPGESKRIVWALGAGEDREELLGRFEAMKRPGAVEKAFGIVP